MDDEEYYMSKLHELELLDEQRYNVLIHLQAYQNRIHCSYNKKVLVRNFDICDLVLMENPKNQME
jgi:hypothetical protein